MRLCGRLFSTPRARNDYATHVPILIGLARIREIKSVLELGCGHYSTLLFLNRSAFPDLERLQSVENDTSWAETIAEVAKHDKRWTLTLVEGEISESISTLDLEAFDLILIDDSKTAAQRASTIQAIGAKDPRRPWMVIHDYEVAEYRRAASGFREKCAFKAYNPWTGLVWNSVTDARRAKSLDRVLRNNNTREPDDLEAWIECFSDQRILR
ncbi:MAG TPA: class I SAM-dependent methyltransferase [Pyrinomonadaceae bacterium]|nr:class I SAM-dependent methyltransferase [Pyrinomonadaceae bacterium]